MQTTVPHPFKTDSNNAAPLNMPGGQWAREDKYLSSDLHDHHATKLKKKAKGINDASFGLSNNSVFPSRHNIFSCVLSDVLPKGSHSNQFRPNSFITFRYISSFAISQVCLCPNKHACIQTKTLGGFGNRQIDFTSCNYKLMSSNDQVQLSQKERLKRAVKDYGATVIVFHVAISLASLGFFYLLVSR